ncbi:MULTISPECIES: class I SAM-dependent methyltransferase [Oceanobacillus]|uniref:class I SAM-dependent methyltransferase n=1 Tax=Oceanobacillus TaxID=182709 RepID=UPI00034DCB01|nr:MULTISPECIES: class I SAM-dependent methyltransferase [Oceanobacillus]MBT2601332.1 class I SAM-dependent methyltransferase [Oceanobacillus sp. ISL-74]MBT2653395.1 class I SAM-dependent methyltransferase [Oceanobacillus sp. ISL-73]MCT1579201.1 class I SAM-dependent methyltransferase [Oceanobacillus kimchii]MCT2138002.1 class I SAM-dependent methyltransferase [Oceanobacillus kimchii]OEH53200.1 16S rRNA methyltransferase [Oceanobacillus sp. E9]
MSEHYFSNNPQSKTSPRTWMYELRGRTFRFTSDIGVFSKNDIDFGSRLLIEQFQEPQINGDILDVGCGYGPIGLSLAAEFNEREVSMIDVNERAVELAKKNASANNVTNVTIQTSDLYSAIDDESRFAAVVTNPPIRAGKKVVHQIFEGAKELLLPNGELWVVIQKKQGAPSAKDKLDDLFGNVEIVKKDKGYFILKAQSV